MIHIRTQSLRHALNDLRARHAAAVALIDATRLGCGSKAWTRHRASQRRAGACRGRPPSQETSDVRVEDGVMLGYFEVIHRGARNGKKIGTTTYVP